jgi:glucose-1-phosphate cytidylyltransferase
MKTIILAGGFGTRISEETEDKPKPMVLLDSNPIIWHLMDIYSSYGYKDFVIATGYKSDVIDGWVQKLRSPWRIEAMDTGLLTQTGGRIKRAFSKIAEESCFVTYGDGLGNVNLAALLDFHRSHGRLVTVTAVRPPARFGHLTIEGNKVTRFGEKQHADGGWINGGFFVVNREVEEMIDSDATSFEADVLPKLAKNDELRAFHHYGFWQPMDTLRERNELSALALSKTPPWKEF